MRALVYKNKNHLEIENRPMPKIGVGEILIQVDYCGLCGTDIKKIEYGLGKPGVVLGHEITGTVVETQTPQFDVGDRVAVAHHVPCFECHYCRHGSVSMCALFKSSALDPGGYSEFCRIPQTHVAHTVFKLNRLSLEEGIFMEPLACVERALDRERSFSNSLAVVVGLGSMGLLAAQALAARGVAVIGLDLNPARLALAKTLGVSEAINAKAPHIRDLIFEKTEGRGCDFLLVSAGPATLLSTYISWIRSGGTLNLFASFYPEAPALLPVNDLYHREIQLSTSYSASPDSLKKAHALLESGKVQVKPLISEIYPFSQVMEGIRQIGAQEALKILIDPKMA